MDGYNNFTEANKDIACRWSEKNLYNYLRKPSEYAPGTSMRHDGIQCKQDRVDLIGFLKRLHEDH